MLDHFQIPSIHTVCVDVADIEATKKEIEKLDQIHMLVNNAGVTELQSFLDVTPQAYDKYVTTYSPLALAL